MTNKCNNPQRLEGRGCMVKLGFRITTSSPHSCRYQSVWMLLSFLQNRVGQPIFCILIGFSWLNPWIQGGELTVDLYPGVAQGSAVARFV